MLFLFRLDLGLLRAYEISIKSQSEKHKNITIRAIKINILKIVILLDNTEVIQFTLIYINIYIKAKNGSLCKAIIMKNSFCI